MLLCTIATMRSSTIHEYYQLPLLLFSSPLIGLGWQTWHQQRPRWQPQMLLSLALMVSLTVLSLDYWAVEHRQRRGWMPLALTIRRDLPSDATDCERHQTDPNPAQPGPPSGLADLQQTTNAGATAKTGANAGASHLAGSFVWDKTYRPMPKRRQQSAPAGDGGGKPPCLDGPTQPDLSDPDR